ncbi:hypothetical protein [Pseudoalteromonas sp. T1lg23B]|uniref:hypothetical protein n=1 Tax=Pseudoalteromonas sp. T1lg23B TaxID=2077097 RepID=UPI000CF6EF55|nr:hypothetical protein [Pseudoalteromonas sp. T1lg23B]
MLNQKHIENLRNELYQSQAAYLNAVREVFEELQQEEHGLAIDKFYQTILEYRDVKYLSQISPEYYHCLRSILSINSLAIQKMAAQTEIKA